MNKDSKIYVAGHKGLVGSAIWKNLQLKGYSNLLGRSFECLDLKDEKAVDAFFEKEKPEYVFLAAAKVGGIYANNVYRADFIYENLQIQNHVIHQSYQHGVKKLLFLGSTCIYPKSAPQPMTEDVLLTSALEYTNEPYAIAKIAGIKMCESYNLQYGSDFLSVMPTNLYGPNDNFNLETSHVLPGIMRKMYIGACLEGGREEEIRRDLSLRPIERVNGKSCWKDILAILEKYGVYQSPTDYCVEIWGSGKPMREFLWSEEMADACVYVMENVSFKALIKEGDKEIRNTHINIGTGIENSIAQTAEMIKKCVGFKGKLIFNTEKPDGSMRKLTDVSKLHALGWHHRISLEEGIKKLYDWYISTVNSSI